MIFNLLKKDKSRQIIILLLLIACVSLTFWNVRSYDFINWDDDLLIHDNQRIRTGNIGDLAWFWRHPYLGLYMPLTYTMWGLLASVAEFPNASNGTGLDATIFHSFSLILHIGCAVLVLFLVKRLMLRAGNPLWVAETASLCAALVFGLHPLQVEAIVWLAELKGVLSGFLALAALHQYVIMLELSCAQADSDSRDQKQTTRPMITGSILFLAALLSKPSVVSLPLIAIVIDMAIYRRSWFAAFRNSASWLVLALAFGLLARSLQADQAVTASPWWAKPIIAADALSFYIAKWLWPENLTLNYGRSPNWVLAQPWVYYSWLAPAFVVGLVVWQWKRGNRWPMAVIGIVTAATLPVLGFIPFLFQYYSTVSDRYFYLAMLGPAFLIGVITAAALQCLSMQASHGQLPPSQRYGLALLWCAALPLVFTAWGITSNKQAENWKDGLTQLTYSLKMNPRDVGSMQSLAAHYMRTGEYAKAQDLLLQALKLASARGKILMNLGIMKLETKQPGEALDYLNKAVEIVPDEPGVYVAASGALMQLNRKEEALGAAKEALEIEPDRPKTLYQIADVLRSMKQLAEARKYSERLVSQHPGIAKYQVLHGEICLESNDLNAAVSCFVEAVALQPTDVDMRLKLVHVLQLQGRTDVALNVLNEALKLEPQNPQLQNALKRMQSGRSQTN